MTSAPSLEERLRDTVDATATERLNLCLAAADRIAELKRERDEARRLYAVEAHKRMVADEQNAAAIAECAKLRAALTDASQVLDAMVIQFRNRDQQPPEPALIQAGKIVLAEIRAALAGSGTDGEKT